MRYMLSCTDETKRKGNVLVEHHSLADIARRGADDHLELAVRLEPLVLFVAPRRDVVLAQRKVDLLGLPFGDPFTSKAAHHLGRLAC